MQRWFPRQGYEKIGVEAICRRSNTSKPEPGQKIFPYLLRKVPVT